MTPTQHALEDLTPHQLVAEIREIAAQYQAEVSTKRRTWPASIRERIVALGRQGVNPHRIAELSEVPYTTILCWLGRSKPTRGPQGSKPRVARASREGSSDGGRFLPVPTTADSTVEPTTVVPTTVVGLTVVFANGFEVRGLSSLAQVTELYRLLGGRP